MQVRIAAAPWGWPEDSSVLPKKTEPAGPNSGPSLFPAGISFSRDFEKTQARVNSVFMGWMWGPPVEGFVNGSAKSRGIPAEQVVAEITEAIPLGFIPDDADCANAVMFFASDLSRVITGAGLDVNGGEFMPPA